MRTELIEKGAVPAATTIHAPRKSDYTEFGSSRILRLRDSDWNGDTLRYENSRQQIVTGFLAFTLAYWSALRYFGSISKASSNFCVIVMKRSLPLSAGYICSSSCEPRLVIVGGDANWSV